GLHARGPLPSGPRRLARTAHAGGPVVQSQTRRWRTNGLISLGAKRALSDTGLLPPRQDRAPVGAGRDLTMRRFFFTLPTALSGRCKENIEQFWSRAEVRSLCILSPRLGIPRPGIRH